MDRPKLKNLCLSYYLDHQLWNNYSLQELNKIGP